MYPIHGDGLRCANDPELGSQGVVDVDAWSWDETADGLGEDEDWHVDGGPRSHADTDVIGAKVTFRRAPSDSGSERGASLELETEDDAAASDPVVADRDGWTPTGAG